MSSTTIGTTFTDVTTKGPTRNFNVKGSADLVVVWETSNAAGAGTGGRIKDPRLPPVNGVGVDLANIGAASHSPPVIDASPYVRYVALQGTVTAVWMDDAPQPSAGPAGAAGLPWNVTAVKVDDYTAVANDLVLCDPTSKAFAVNLPSAATAGAGARVGGKNTTTNTSHAITFTRAGSDTIDGATTLAMATSKGCKVLVSDGVSAWFLQS